MTPSRIGALATLAILALAVSLPGLDRATAEEKARDGKAVFLENKCNSCHTVEALKIVKKADDSEKAEKPKNDKKAPDLSSVGLERKADWMALYLMKKEAIKGEKHERRFRGSEADLKLVTTWLAEQTAKKKK